MIVLNLVAAALATAGASGQSFEVAVIRAHDPNGETTFPQTGGRLHAVLTLKYMIQEAYDAAPAQLFGGPAWIGQDL
jgi:uncharacterized protein (TIGR03435 family)